jgi:hypothetical protein
LFREIIGLGETGKTADRRAASSTAASASNKERRANTIV